MKRWMVGGCAVLMMLGIGAVAVRAQEETTTVTQPTEETPPVTPVTTTPTPATTEEGSTTTPATTEDGTTTTAVEGAIGSTGTTAFTPPAATVETTIVPALVAPESGNEDAPNLPAELGGGPVYRPGDQLASNEPAPAVGGAAGAVQRVLPLVPGGNPVPMVNPTGVNPAMPAQVLERVATPAAGAINDALSGRGPAGPAGSLGSITRPTGFFSSTPNVSLDVDGRNISIPPPSMSRGQSMSFYSVPQSNGSVAVEARSGNESWRLQGGPNTISPIFGSSWSWVKK